jgi:hypothetical protein
MAFWRLSSLLSLLLSASLNKTANSVMLTYRGYQVPLYLRNRLFNGARINSCNCIYVIRKVRPSLNRFFTKLTNAQQHYVKVSYSEFSPISDNKHG